MGTSVITESIRLAHCWICQASVSLNEHHVVPRSYGGENGPTVTLCSDCHELIHKLADAEAYDDHYMATPKICYLVKVIVRARRAAHVIGGKNWKYSRVWTDGQHTKLMRLAKVYGTQDSAINAALDMLYRSHFDLTKIS